MLEVYRHILASYFYWNTCITISAEGSAECDESTVSIRSFYHLTHRSIYYSILLSPTNICFSGIFMLLNFCTSTFQGVSVCKDHLS
ncbi:hypothetical protein XELAEV_18028823mg [Xenopus laevis]|uniref:Uncharacterized protein n=1 Tax=Xenopus laevis TaxID=8355 RepID=A0A974CQC3_XENLA|nr:hypothetical protein XELAEV_18028823mg [Xenopus laevis]